MVSAENARTGLGIVGNITAIILFLSTALTFHRIWKRKSVEDYSPVPYLAAFVNCGLWVLYGLPFVTPNSVLVITTNGIGFAIESVYLLIFLVCSERKKKLRISLIILAEVVFLGAIAVLVMTLVHTKKLRSTIIGSICIAANIVMYASPLSVMKMVITTKSVEYMPFLLSLFCFANGLCWFCYALIHIELFIAVPNGIGAVFGFIQLMLYAFFYKSTKEIIAARKANEEMANVGLKDMGLKPNNECVGSV